MKKILIVIGAMLIVGALSVFISLGLTKKKAALQVTSTPKASVFINDSQVGTTPYESDQVKPGEINLRLVPEGTGLNTWERKLTLNPNTKLVVSKNFDPDPDKEESQVLYFEKTASKDKAGLMLTSIPDGVSVTVDGQMRGFAPVNLEDISAGDRKIFLSHPAFRSREILARAISGYRLVAEIKLAKDENVASSSATEESNPTETVSKPYVVIKETPTGWLRVRVEPSTSASEAARLNPGEKFSLVEKKQGWYKVKYESGKEGWISSQYADIFE